MFPPILDAKPSKPLQESVTDSNKTAKTEVTMEPEQRELQKDVELGKKFQELFNRHGIPPLDNDNETDADDTDNYQICCRLKTLTADQILDLEGESPKEEILQALRTLRNFYQSIKEKPKIEDQLNKSTKQDISYHKSWKKLSKEIIENEKKKCETPIVTAAENQAKYLQKFGVNFQIP